MRASMPLATVALPELSYPDHSPMHPGFGSRSSGYKHAYSLPARPWPTIAPRGRNLSPLCEAGRVSCFSCHGMAVSVEHLVLPSSPGISRFRSRWRAPSVKVPTDPASRLSRAGYFSGALPWTASLQLDDGAYDYLDCRSPVKRQFLSGFRHVRPVTNADRRGKNHTARITDCRHPIQPSLVRFVSQERQALGGR